MAQEFSAQLEKGSHKGAWTCIIVSDVKKTYGTGGLVKVKGTIDGAPFESALMPQGDGTHRLPVKQAVRDAIGKQAGDRVTVRLA